MVKQMIKDGGELKANSAPKGPRERRLEALLNRNAGQEEDEEEWKE